MVVFKISSINFLDRKITQNTRLQLCTIRSHAPPWCGALDGLYFHLRPLCTSDSRASAFRFLLQWSSYFSAPTKFVPLSDHIIEGVPRLEIKRSIAITHELVFMDGTRQLQLVYYASSKSINNLFLQNGKSEIASNFRPNYLINTISVVLTLVWK